MADAATSGVQLDALGEMYLHLHLLKSGLHVLLETIPRHPEYQLVSGSFPKLCLKKLYHTSKKKKNVQKNGLFNKLNLVPRTVSTFECSKLKQKP